MSRNKFMDAESLVDFFDTEDIIEKIQTIHEMERRNRYTPISQEMTYWERVRLALSNIPNEYKYAAYAVFANVVYLTSDLLTETMSMLANETAIRCDSKGYDLRQDVHFFAVDHPGLVDDLFQVGAQYRWHARQDRIAQRYFRLVSFLLDGLLELPTVGEERKNLIREVFEKRVWLLLTDNAFSGGSARSDIQRLNELREMFSKDPSCKPEILVLAQVITDEALNHLTEVCPKDDIYFGLLLDNRFKINHEDCALFKREETRTAVVDLCKWFGEQHFTEKNPYQDELMPLKATLERHWERGCDPNFAYGWRDCGYTVVAHKNCPTNSLPILWFPVISDQVALPGAARYVPPFPRNHSRFEQTTSKDAEKLHRLKESAERTRSVLWG